MDGGCIKSDEDQANASGMPCWIVRATSRTGCIIQLQHTGAVVEVELNTPWDLSRACLICAIHPVRATVKLGELQNNVFRNCELIDVDWPRQQTFPPPKRYQRSKRQTHEAGTDGASDILDCT